MSAAAGRRLCVCQSLHHGFEATVVLYFLFKSSFSSAIFFFRELNILVPRAPTFFFKLLNEGLWDHPKISFFSFAVQNLMRNKVKSATLLRIGLYFR